MNRITIEDLSFCVVETANVSQVCGGLTKEVYSKTGKGAWSASYDSAYIVGYEAGYSVDKKKGTISSGISAGIASGVAGAIASAVSDGEQHVSTQADASVSLIG